MSPDVEVAGCVVRCALCSQGSISDTIGYLVNLDDLLNIIVVIFVIVGRYPGSKVQVSHTSKSALIMV